MIFKVSAITLRLSLCDELRKGLGDKLLPGPPPHLARKGTRNLQLKQLRQYLHGILRLRD